MTVLADFDFEGASLPAFSGTTGTPAVSSAQQAHGAQSMKCDASGGATNAYINTQKTAYTARVYVNLAQTVSGDNIFASFLNSPQNKAVDFGWNTTNSKYFVRSYDSTFTEIARSYSTSGLGTGAWVRLECSINPAANPWVVKWKFSSLDTAGTAETDFQPALASDTVAYSFLGVGATAAVVVYFDDYKLTDSLADYPLGAVAGSQNQQTHPFINILLGQ